MHTDGIIGVDDLLGSALLVQDDAAFESSMEQMKQLEPCLAGYLGNEITLIAGKLSLAGAPPPVVRELTQRAASLVLVVFHAQRSACLRLWAESFPDSPLASLINLVSEKPPEEQTP
jgi:hypothetical protein